MLCMAVLMVTGSASRYLPSAARRRICSIWAHPVNSLSAGMVFTVVLLMRIMGFCRQSILRQLFIVPVWRKLVAGRVVCKLLVLFLAKRPTADIGHNPIAQAAMFGYFRRRSLRSSLVLALYSEHSQYAILVLFR
ncbi:hypothetical protein ACNKHP_03065 [Shigella boydii]